MNPIEIIERYYDSSGELYRILITHSLQVRDKAMDIIARHPEFGADMTFVSEAAMLHDIGIYLTDAPGIHCFGTHQYIEHGYLGAAIVLNAGYPRHSLVCERHTGTGLSVDWIIKNKLPLPLRELKPVSIEEQIICYADKFFSKTKLNQEQKLERIVDKMRKFSESNVQQFLAWHEKFS